MADHFIREGKKMDTNMNKQSRHVEKLSSKIVKWDVQIDLLVQANRGRFAITNKFLQPDTMVPVASPGPRKVS